MTNNLVLVVDDYLDSGTILGKLLNHLGYATANVSSGKGALAFLAANSVGLILLDNVMPVMSGLELLALIQADAALAHIPVVMLSALSDEWWRTCALAGGARDYFVKGSFGLTEMEQMLKALLPHA